MRANKVPPTRVNELRTELRTKLKQTKDLGSSDQSSTQSDQSSSKIESLPSVAAHQKSQKITVPPEYLLQNYLEMLNYHNILEIHDQKIIFKKIKPFLDKQYFILLKQ